MMINDVIQSVVVPPGEFGPGPWPALLPDRAPARSMILGLGGGTIVHLLTRQFGAHPIVGIEIDPNVIALGRAHFGLDLPHLQIVEADALGLVARLSGLIADDSARATNGRFDYILVDLYEGGSIVRASLGRPFLRQIRALVTPDGSVVFNLFRDRRVHDRLHRLRQMFAIERTVPVNLNLAVHCRLATGSQAEPGGSK
jgi:spermidine synthase